MAADRPDTSGYFGEFGGRYVPETLVGPLRELGRSWNRASRRRSFRRRLEELASRYGGRPTPLYEARALSARLGGARILLKREDLLAGGSHKLNNALGQVLLAKAMGLERVIAETATGEHGAAVAGAAALAGLACTVYIGVEDARRQPSSVERMRMLGAEVLTVDLGGGKLAAAMSEALRDWSTNARHTHLAVGSVRGPDPYPRLVAHLQMVVGREAARQLRKSAGRAHPDLVIASVGAGSLASGLFGAFLGDPRVRLIGVEAGGRGPSPGEHAAKLRSGTPGVIHGMRTLVLQDAEGLIAPTHSIAAGLDYPAVGPQHADLAASGRVEYTTATDREAVEAYRLLAAREGILPSLESAHALAEAVRHARELAPSRVVLVALSGRGEKDIALVQGFEAGCRADGSVTGPPGAARDWGDESQEALEPGELEPLEVSAEPPARGRSARE